MVPRNDSQPHLERPQANQRLLSIQSLISRCSFRSHSSSFADDEHSSTTASPSTMRPRSSNSVEAAGKPRYPDEDTRPTSQQELAGWYFYGIAAETYVICGISSFIPILLETLAREHGVLYSDRKTPCLDSTHSRKGDGQCVVQLFGFEINTASFAMYFFSASVLLQALLVVSISSAADHGKSRKRLLLTFAWIGSAAVMAYIFITTDVYLVGGVLLIISNTAFGASFVLLNSFMPLLVRYHPKVLYAESSIPTLESSELDRSQSEANDEAATASAPLLLPGGVTEPAPPALKPTTPNGMHPNPHVLLTELQLSTEISSKGVGIGYSAALFVQCVSIIIMLSMGSSTWSQRVVLLFVGSWWAFFTIPTALWLRPRPGPPLQQTGSNGSMAWFSYVQQSWKSLWRTVKLTRRLVDIVLFLVSWFLLSDAIATTSSTAILFAKTTLGMPAWALGLISVITSVTGVLGAFSWSFISKKLGLRPHQTILACIGLFELVPLYGLLGYLPIVQRWGVFGLQQRWEMYPLGALYGFVLGGLSSYCRSLYGELIPPGSEAAFYALYAITDKGSSVFGPAIVGTIIDATGDIRPGFFFLAFLIGAPVPFIYFVDVERGKRAGAKLARVIEGCDSREDMSSSDDADGEEEGRRMLVDYECDSGGAGGEGDATGFRTIGEHETGPTADGKYTTSTSNAVRQR